MYNYYLHEKQQKEKEKKHFESLSCHHLKTRHKSNINPLHLNIT